MLIDLEVNQDTTEFSEEARTEIDFLIKSLEGQYQLNSEQGTRIHQLTADNKKLQRSLEAVESAQKGTKNGLAVDNTKLEKEVAELTGKADYEHDRSNDAWEELRNVKEAVEDMMRAERAVQDKIVTIRDMKKDRSAGSVWDELLEEALGAVQKEVVVLKVDYAKKKEAATKVMKRTD
ncbi:hypothetical protein LTR36_003501 [Oleoguttula mirabilis]|uniref:Uncharacterized protein n=1 Tax=Oleoguttula mirabilis TaxID=1507867 RepID=A0AAV9JIV9_9PEZI|nr:hypothetical protein LTR36_003501 [Oleoguttula mirabilis]